MRDTDDGGVTSFPLTHCRPSPLFLFPKLSAEGQQPALHVPTFELEKNHPMASNSHILEELMGRPRGAMAFRCSLYPTFSVLKLSPSSVCRCPSTALQLQTPGCRGVTQGTCVTVSLAEQGWPPQPREEAPSISTLARGVSSGDAQ